MKRYFTTLVVIIVSFMLTTSCEKEPIPDDTETTPVFTFDATIDGTTSVSLVAGQNDYYMRSHFNTDANGLKTYTGILTTINCVDFCANSLKITFIDYDFSIPNPTLSDSTFYVGNYNYATNSGAASRYTVDFTKVSLGPAVTGITWDFGDGNSIVELNPSHTYVRPGNYNFCMDANFSGGCTSNLCNTLHLGNIGKFCEANLVISPPTGTSFNFSANGNQGIEPYTYLWDFGDGNTSTEEDLTYAYAAEGVYTITLTVTDSEGTSETIRQNVRTENNTDCVARNIHNVIPLANPNNFGNVIVEWTDANGNVYTSKNDNQALRSYFKVNSVEEYNLNENGEKTKKISIEFSCILYNGADQIEMQNATAVIAVAYE